MSPLAAMLAATLTAACPAGLPPAPAGPLAPPPAATYLATDGAVRIVGYNDMRGMIAAWDAAFVRLHPGLRFQLDLPSTRSAPPALIEGRSAMAPMGAPMTPDDLARATAAFGAPPLVIAVAHDSLDPTALSGPLGIVVAKDNPLASLSLAEVARLFAAADGPHTWGELGLTGRWASAPIHLVGLAPPAALAQFLKARLFPGRDFAAGLSGLAHSTDVARAVAADPFALGFASLNIDLAGLHVLPLSPEHGARPVAPSRANLRDGRYPLDRQLLIYARRPLDPVVRGYLELVLSCEGQAAVAADPLGYIPLTAPQAAAERTRLAEGARP